MENVGSDGLVHPVHWWEGKGLEDMNNWIVYSIVYSLAGHWRCTVTIQLTRLLRFRNYKVFPVSLQCPLHMSL